MKKILALLVMSFAMMGCYVTAEPIYYGQAPYYYSYYPGSGYVFIEGRGWIHGGAYAHYYGHPYYGHGYYHGGHRGRR